MTPEIPKDSMILVTGCNGFVASHIVDQLLILGYRVRGTTRDLANVETISAQWKDTHGKGRFEAILIPNIAEELFDKHLDGELLTPPSVFTLYPLPTPQPQPPSTSNFIFFHSPTANSSHLAQPWNS